MVSIEDRVGSAISHPGFVVFSSTHCPNSAAVKKSLTDAQIPFQVHEIDQWGMKEKEDAQNYLEELTGERTTPRVYKDGCCIGGNKEFQRDFVHSGRLSDLRGG